MGPRFLEIELTDSSTLNKNVYNKVRLLMTAALSDVLLF